MELVNIVERKNCSSLHGFPFFISCSDGAQLAHFHIAMTRLFLNIAVAMFSNPSYVGSPLWPYMRRFQQPADGCGFSQVSPVFLHHNATALEKYFCLLHETPNK